MHFVASELKHALRRLTRAPFFTGVALVTLAIGIGGNTAIFSVIEGILLKPLPYSHPDELVSLELTAPGINVKDADLAPSDYFIFREQNRTLRDLAVYEGYSVNITGSGEPEHAAGLLVTDGLLPILGVSPMLGRSFTHADDSPDAPATVILSYGYWRHKFGGHAPLRLVRQHVRSDISDTLSAHERHADIKLFAQNVDRFGDARLAVGSHAIGIGAADQAAFGAKRQRPQHVLSAANATVE